MAGYGQKDTTGQSVYDTPKGPICADYAPVPIRVVKPKGSISRTDVK